jgi:hypothetical protein
MTLQTDLAAAVTKVTADSTLLHKVVHGPASGTECQVITEGGPVKTVAKAIADIDTRLQSGLETLDQKVADAATSSALAVHSADVAETSEAAIAPFWCGGAPLDVLAVYPGAAAACAKTGRESKAETSTWMKGNARLDLFKSQGPGSLPQSVV